MLGRGNKTDKLDARGLNRLQRAGTLPTGWLPPGALRDQRDLPRTRRVLTRERTRLQHRIHATLAQDRPAPGGDARSLRAARPPVAPQHRPPPAGAAPPGLPRSASSSSWTWWWPRSRAAHGLGAPPGPAAPPDAPWGRGGPGRGPPPGGRRHPPLPARGAARPSAGTPPRVHASGGRTHSGPARGDIHRYRTWACIEAARTRLSHAARPAAPARQPPLGARPAAEGARDGGRRGRAPPMGSSPSGSPPTPRRRPRRGQREVPMSARRSDSECDAPPGHPQAARTAEIGFRCHRHPGPRSRGGTKASEPRPPRRFTRQHRCPALRPPVGRAGPGGGSASSDRHFIYIAQSGAFRYGHGEETLSLV